MPQSFLILSLLEEHNTSRELQCYSTRRAECSRVSLVVLYVKKKWNIFWKLVNTTNVHERNQSQAFIQSLHSSTRGELFLLVKSHLSWIAISIILPCEPLLRVRPVCYCVQPLQFFHFWMEFWLLLKKWFVNVFLWIFMLHNNHVEHFSIEIGIHFI